jgi:hypothetical protein
LRRYHEHNVCSHEFQVGDLVLRWVQSNKYRHKLAPPWEGPFIVDQVLQPESFKIQYEDGRVVSNTWNKHLHPFYPWVNVHTLWISE